MALMWRHPNVLMARTPAIYTSCVQHRKTYSFCIHLFIVRCCLSGALDPAYRDEPHSAKAIPWRWNIHVRTRREVTRHPSWRHHIESNDFRITGSFWGQSTGHQWNPLTLGQWCFLYCKSELAVEQTVIWWSDTTTRSCVTIMKTGLCNFIEPGRNLFLYE